MYAKVLILVFILEIRTLKLVNKLQNMSVKRKSLIQKL